MRNILKNTLIGICLLSSLGLPLHSQTIAEKKAGIVSGTSELTPEMQKFLAEMNKELRKRRTEIQRLQDKVVELYQQNAPPEAYQELLIQINDAKENVQILQENWREMATKPGVDDEEYALWHQPETTLEQLVIDYGSLDYVYLLSPEIAKIQVSVSSNIPIPRASWGEMLEQILLQNGVGIRELNPYLRELYLVREDLSNLRLITANALDLEAYPDNARVSFVISPEPLDVKRIWYFLEKFANPNSTVLQRIGRVILIVGQVSDVKDLLKIHNFVTTNKRDLEYKAVPLYRVSAEEMAKILQTIFKEFVEEVDVEEAKGKTKDKTPTFARKSKSEDVNALNVIALPKVAHAVFLIGTKSEIQKAEDVINEVESQVGEARERSIFWYNVKHSDPEELAQVMEKIYYMLIESRIGYTEEVEKRKEEEKIEKEIERKESFVIDEVRNELLLDRMSQPQYFNPPYYQQGDYSINPRPIRSAYEKEKEYNKGRDNFIVDPKAGALVMVVENDILPKLKEIIKKLDVPKKMVQIEVLLFERTMRRDNEYGLNLLKLGDAASQTHTSNVIWNGGLEGCFDAAKPPCTAGILEFFFSRKRTSCGIPAFDFAYKFLMTQDDVYLNASPSVIAMNQTEASIKIKDERSILIGTNIVDSASVVAQTAFTRAQYGIEITVTPTIHMADEEDFFEDPTNYITLVSQINFDTFPPGQELSNQPRVNRREIQNEVRLPDGQAVIIGGLRRKETDDSIEKVPFLGEIPGLGKLFSTTKLEDTDTEMIIFMTPKIISEPKEDFARLRREELCRRPGDIPAFLCRLNEALDREKNRLFQGYMTILFGRPRTRYICEEGEYNGR
ncbi:MAG: Type IV pilus biogenesis and competence protein PilQ [Chlamydiae bacterium]|nr:Type IV pilus biogenesis and competence protein PilQ [Chlamydiota bacterium]